VNISSSLDSHAEEQTMGFFMDIFTQHIDTKNKKNESSGTESRGEIPFFLIIFQNSDIIESITKKFRFLLEQ